MRRLTYIDYHTCGEPVRIVTGGYPELPGDTILAKRRAARENHDHLRRAMMLEPRGHAGMYGVIPVTPSHPDAVIGVLFTHNEGYSTMCGHATIAIGRYLVESGLVAPRGSLAEFAIEAPCGLLQLTVEITDGRPGRVSFRSVPAFASALDAVLNMPDGRKVSGAVAFGGAYYFITPTNNIGASLMSAPLDDLLRAGTDLTAQGRRQLNIVHPSEPDLAFLYGTIITDDALPPEPSSNLCIFAEGQIDRSPTGSGVTARMALDHARGLIGLHQPRSFTSVTGGVFIAEIVAETLEGVIVSVSGQSYLAGRGEFIIEEDDPLGHGFALPERFGSAVV